LSTAGVWDAVRDGANAIEIDMMPNKGGWNAQHDDVPGGRGDTAELMFKTIAQARTQGKPITFVWLDLKGPDWCLPEHGSQWSQCTIQALRDLAAKYLQPVGVKALYGFYTGKEKSLATIASSMKAFEAINVDGEAQKCQDIFQNVAPKADRSKLIMSYGYWDLPQGFGECYEENYQTCTELRKGHASDKFGKVFGWTSEQGHSWYVNKMLKEAGVDGIIYGHGLKDYASDDGTKAAIADIQNWVKNHKASHRMATWADAPW
jgi:hypothetical protein